jgi:hypothetical protein
MIKFTYSRYTWKATEGDPFVSATIKKNITLEKAISLMANYLRRMPNTLSYDNMSKKISCELASSRLGASTSSEAFIESNKGINPEEAIKIIQLITEKLHSFPSFKKNNKV